MVKFTLYQKTPPTVRLDFFISPVTPFPPWSASTNANLSAQSSKRHKAPLPTLKDKDFDSSRPCFEKLLAECGVVISDPPSTPTAYDVSVNQATLRSSISALLKELQATRTVDLDKVRGSEGGVEDCLVS